MTASLALAGVLAAPLLQALLVLLFARPPGLRDVTHILGAGATAAFALIAANDVAHGHAARLVLARPLPNVDLAFSIEPLGALFAAFVAGLGFLHAVHSAGIVRAAHEKAPARLMAFMALAIGATMAIAFSANLFSFFVGYQALILAVFPLVAHRGDKDSTHAARSLLITLFVTSVGLLLPAMVWTYSAAGALDFQAGGVLAGRLDVVSANALLVLFVFGIAMCAIPPMHRWLSEASGAPYSALTSIYALTVLPAGALGIVKIAAYVFGAELLVANIARIGLLLLAGVGMCVFALIALSKQDVRDRLAYSCMAQTLAAVMGALLALPAGLFASTLQIVATCCSAATLFMAVGTVAALTQRVRVEDYIGLGRAQPWTFAAFTLASASMIGMPPFSGAWAKLWLITAAAGARVPWAAALAATAAILTFAHLGPLAANAFGARAPTDPFKRPDGASILLVAPVVLAAAATLWLLVLADPLASFLSPVWTPR